MSANFFRPSPVNWIVTIGWLPPRPGFEIVERASEMSLAEEARVVLEDVPDALRRAAAAARLESPRSS